MDRTRPAYGHHKSSSTAGAPPSPVAFSATNHRRSGSATATAGISNARRPHNTKAVAQRLAQVMSNQSNDDEEEEEDDLLYDYAPPANSSGGVGLAGGPGERPVRSRSPMSVRASTENHASPARSAPRMRSSPSVGSLEQQSSSDNRSVSATRSSLTSIEQSPSVVRPISAMRASQLSSSEQPLSNAPSSTNSTAARSSQPVAMEQPSSARSTSATRPNNLLAPKAVPILPSSVPISLRTSTPELQSDSRMDRRLSVDLGTFKNKEANIQPSSALQDEVDMLQEENESLLEKIRLAEERYEEAEARTRLLEKQVANLGEGVSMESRLLARKEAALQQREAALKVAAQNYGGKGEEVETLRAEVEVARHEATSATENLQEAESEIKSLCALSHKMILTPEEKEEVVLKRCWLARYWGLCVEHGIHADIAEIKHEYWSSFAPSPNEVVLEAGQRAKDENSLVGYNDMEEGENLQQGVELLSDGNVESMFLVEKGLQEQTSLKVEEAVALAMAQQRPPSSLRSCVTADELKLPIEGQNFADAFELSEDEVEDVRFKLAWLTYYWRRAKKHGLEADIADERLGFLINHATHTFNSHDAINVERGLMELKQLGIEGQLWKLSQTYRSKK
ncbi:PREDICTED: coiled-coil domain-containing protein SCD2-like isoform X3 [Ipomoea nil]|uniref:coiled-coil domain-containing protein SCD2-like isoform X3 n=1 Tax=Ipomoea nil TaxID=35883 RepID=UPI000900E0F1|nr:PREDICTED: coiled-coil domain-containing protein SCD2-like isoform X3 [Ipomoea nil]